jgi:lipopolysaccharide/colanic/teichoic acid biosynthesis glycosyltransferase
VTSVELARTRASVRWSRPGRTPALAAAPTPRPEGARRSLNLVIAATAMVVAAPVMVVIAALIKLTSRGPVLYRQPRVGRDAREPGNGGGNRRRLLDYGGRPFTIYKFRTMQPFEGEGEAWATPDDPRVTPLGRILRKYRLDELPQLFNVLRGDMNFVGPRPEQPKIFAELRAQIPGYQRRQLVRPGITGWAQVKLPYDRSIDDVKRKVAFDLEYVARHSILEDLKIILRTVPVVVLKRGAW